MRVKIKKLSKDAVIPTYAKDGDAGMDLTAVSISSDALGNVVYGTGLSFEIPKGYVGLLFPRSSNANKDLLLSNSVGVLDSGYRGEVAFKFKAPLHEGNTISQNGEKIERNGGFIKYKMGERIGQIIIMPYPKINFTEVEELSETERGDGGYGSTGK